VRPFALCLAVAACLACSVSADAYTGGGRPWPGGVIRYYNSAADQAWAVKRAVDAWNTSGAGVKFVAAPASRADVRVEHFPKVSCTINAEATVGYAEKARVWIFNRDERSPYCNSYAAAQLLAHEFGHVLGLGHETRGCAAMNPVNTLQGPAYCPKAERWQWRCRLLTPDDVAGAVALYGGSVRAQRGPGNCNLYSSIAAPTKLSVAATSVSHQFKVSFRRPSASPAMPSFLSSFRTAREAFVAAVSSAGCPTNPSSEQRTAWDARPGTMEDTVRSFPAGKSCVSVWAVDSFGRPSDRPASAWIQVVESG
jgi:hypothetical protein